MAHIRTPWPLPTRLWIRVWRHITSPDSPIVEPIPPERRDGVRYSESFNGKEIAEEWLAELRRRLARSAVLLDHGLPDHGFDLLAQEIHLFREVLHHAKEKK